MVSGFQGRIHKPGFITIKRFTGFTVTSFGKQIHPHLRPSKLTYDFYSTEQGIDAALVATYSYMRWGAGNKARYNMMTEMGVAANHYSQIP